MSFLIIVKKIVPLGILEAVRPFYHWLLAALAASVYGRPSRRLIVIGVTGTNGKTTVVHLLHEIFRAAGFRVGSSSSLRFKINDTEEKNLLKMTMPGRFRLQKFLARCRDSGCRFAIIEVTSEGIRQSRHRFINFKAAVLTNIRPEHIEAHGSFDNYRGAKMELFKKLPRSGFAVLNKEDESSKLIAEDTKAETIWYSPSFIEVKHIGHPVHVNAAYPSRTLFEVENVFMEMNLGGDFNVMNALAAIAAAMAFNVSLSAAAQALGQFKGVAGRMEYIQNKPFAVVVDYAHTPDALESVYGTLSSASSKLKASAYAEASAAGKPLADKSAGRQNSKLICVLGAAGGGRDKWKRPEMGKVAANFCREVILTSEDPDDENPQRIMEEIERGFSSNSKFQIPNSKKVVDRREAICSALQDAKPGDTVIITGMGAQPWFIEKGRKIPWDDREVVKEELVKLADVPTNYE